MLKIIRNLLQTVIDRIDAGTSSLTDEEAIKAIGLLKEYTDKDKVYSKYSAYRYLGISRASFDNHIKDGLIPEGKSIAGFKEKVWFKKDLDVYRNSKKSK